MRRGRAGFTLVEFLAILVILGLLASGATLAFGRMLNAGRLTQGADIVAGALREAQTHAFIDGGVWRITVAADNDVLYLERANDPGTADLECGGTGWGGPVQRRYQLPKGVTVGLRSGECIVFGQAGRVLARMPFIDPEKLPEHPMSAASLPRLTDGYQLSDEEIQAWSDPLRGTFGAVVWEMAKMPELLVDLREQRYISTACVGLISAVGISVSYPGHLNIAVTSKLNPGESDWEVVLNKDLPPDPSDSDRKRNPSCIRAVVKREIRYLRVRLSNPRNGKYWALDEIDLGPRFFTVQYGTDTKIVDVNPTTGRVTIRKGS